MRGEMLMKRLRILILMAVFCFIGYVYAAPLSIDFEGKPGLLHPNNIQGCFVWGDEDGIHIRVSTINEKHVFSGTIHSDGRLEDMEEKSLDDDDFSHVKDHNHTINFQFTTSGKAVGIDFYVYQGGYLDFDIYLDGAKINPYQIFVGREGWHPGSNKFTLDYDQRSDDEDRREDRTIIITRFHWGWWYGPHWHHRHW
jgi:hypothetical protein